MITANNESHNETDNEVQLAAAVIGRAFLDTDDFARLLERRGLEFGSKAFIKQCRKNEAGKAQSAFRVAVLETMDAVRFLCWPSDDLRHWAEYLGTDVERINEIARRKLAWMYEPMAAGVV